MILLGEALGLTTTSAPGGRPWTSSPWSRPPCACSPWRTPPTSCCAWTGACKHLLVDEFQDTSQNQMDLLCRLMAGWQAGEGRTLTVVGDPKQSIYGWRQAKPRLFTAAPGACPAPPGGFSPGSLLLTTNFRSTRTLIDWANQVFADVLGQAAAGA